jgi:hypothetical protein
LFGGCALDIYSLGAVLYHALTGRVPFQSNNPLEILAMHINRAPLRPRVLAPDLPEALDLEVMRALEKDPAHRPQSVAEWAIALRRAAGLEASPAGAATGTSARYSPPGNAPTSYLTLSAHPRRQRLCRPRPEERPQYPRRNPWRANPPRLRRLRPPLLRFLRHPPPLLPLPPLRQSGIRPAPTSASDKRARAFRPCLFAFSAGARGSRTPSPAPHRTLLRLAVFSLTFSAILVVAAGVIIYKLCIPPPGRDGQSVVTAPSMPPRTGRAVLVSTETPYPSRTRTRLSPPPIPNLLIHASQFFNLLIRSGIVCWQKAIGAWRRRCSRARGK